MGWRKGAWYYLGRLTQLSDQLPHGNFVWTLADPFHTLSMFGKMIVRYLYQTFHLIGRFMCLLNLTEPTIYLLLLSVWSYSITPFQMSKFKEFRYVLPGTTFVGCCPVCDLEYLWKYVDRYVESFLRCSFLPVRSSSS